MEFIKTLNMQLCRIKKRKSRFLIESVLFLCVETFFIKSFIFKIKRFTVKKDNKSIFAFWDKEE